MIDVVDLSHRQVSEDEVKMWRRVQEYLANRPDDVAVPLTQCGVQAGLHEQRARQIARTWENDGLISLPPNDANTGRVTTAGLQHEMPDPDDE